MVVEITERAQSGLALTIDARRDALLADGLNGVVLVESERACGNASVQLCIEKSDKGRITARAVRGLPRAPQAICITRDTLPCFLILVVPVLRAGHHACVIDIVEKGWISAGSAGCDGCHACQTVPITS